MLWKIVIWLGFLSALSVQFKLNRTCIVQYFSKIVIVLMEVVVTEIAKGILLLFDLCSLETQGTENIELLISVDISVQQECYKYDLLRAWKFRVGLIDPQA